MEPRYWSIESARWVTWDPVAGVEQPLHAWELTPVVAPAVPAPRTGSPSLSASGA